MFDDPYIRPRAKQSNEQVNNIAQIYSPEVETKKPFRRKRKKKTIWTERSCVYFDETAIVESLIDKTAWFENSRVPEHIAILARAYSDDVIAFEVKK